jgi:hypothetical protein
MKYFISTLKERRAGHELTDNEGEMVLKAVCYGHVLKEFIMQSVCLLLLRTRSASMEFTVYAVEDKEAVRRSTAVLRAPRRVVVLSCCCFVVLLCCCVVVLS